MSDEMIRDENEYGRYTPTYLLPLSKRADFANS